MQPKFTILKCWSRTGIHRTEAWVANLGGTPLAEFLTFAGHISAQSDRSGSTLAVGQIGQSKTKLAVKMWCFDDFWPSFEGKEEPPFTC